jgi:elongation factor P
VRAAAGAAVIGPAGRRFALFAGSCYTTRLETVDSVSACRHECNGDDSPAASAGGRPMATKASELKKGKVITHEGALYTITDITRVSKGNWRSYLQIKIKSLKDGRVLDARFGVDDKVEVAYVDTKAYQYLYREGEDFIMMDQESFDQFPVGADIMGDGDKYLRGNEEVTLSFIDGKVVSVELPNTVELKVTDTTPVVKGATATNQSKDATLETGLRIKVPPFIDIGEELRIDTRTGEYLERAKN